MTVNRFRTYEEVVQRCAEKIGRNLEQQLLKDTAIVASAYAIALSFDVDIDQVRSDIRSHL